jgi:hypothetical protein
VMSLYDTSANLDGPIKPGNTDSLPAITTPKTIQAPNKIPSLFPFNRTTVYLLLGSDAPQKKISSVTFHATSPQGPLKLTIDIDNTESRGTTVHQLAARKAIQDLEEGRGWLQTAEIDGVLLKDSHKNRFDEFVEREAVRIGELYQVAGKWTSFVAVDDKNHKASESDGTAGDDAGDAHSQPPLRRAYRMKGTGGGGVRHLKLPAMRMMPSQSMAPQSTVMQSMVSSAPDMVIDACCEVSSVDSAIEPASYAPPSGALALKRSSAPKKKKKIGGGGFMGFGLFGGSDNDNASAGMPTPPPMAGKRSPLHDLISLQTFVGAWDWNDELFAIIGKEVAFDAEAFASKQVMATALAVAFLESKLAASRDVWEMVVAKAKGWMVSQGVADSERAVEVAKGLI